VTHKRLLDGAIDRNREMVDALAAVLDEEGSEIARAVRVGRGAVAGREQLEALMKIKQIINSQLFKDFWYIWNNLPEPRVAELLEMAREMAKEGPADASGGPE
jgi:hypothetical protein